MSTKSIASDLEDLLEDIHEFDYGKGSLSSMMRKTVDAMLELNDEIASLREDLTNATNKNTKRKKA